MSPELSAIWIAPAYFFKYAALLLGLSLALVAIGVMLELVAIGRETDNEIEEDEP